MFDVVHLKGVGISPQNGEPMNKKTLAFAATLVLLAFASAAPTAAATNVEPLGAASMTVACQGEILQYALCVAFEALSEVCYLTPLC